MLRQLRKVLRQVISLPAAALVFVLSVVRLPLEWLVKGTKALQKMLRKVGG